MSSKTHSAVCGLGVPDRARRPTRLEDDDLARLDVADVLGADDVETGRLGREDPAGPGVLVAPQAALGRLVELEPAEHEGPEAVRIADADDPPLIEDDELKAPLTRGRTETSAATVSAAGSSASRAVRSSVSVDAGSRASAALELGQQLPGVDEVAVVADREGPAGPEAIRRLGVLPDRRAGRRVAAMGDGEVAAERREPTLVEDRADEPEVLVEHELLGVADRETGRLLAAVLEGEQAGRRDLGRLEPGGEHGAEDAAHAASALLPECPGETIAPRRGRGRRPRCRGHRRRRCRAPPRRRSRLRRRAR